ncbi:MAG TPA: hypothetical protein VGD77_09565 [Gemmatimonadaceae bacterium]
MRLTHLARARLAAAALALALSIATACGSDAPGIAPPVVTSDSMTVTVQPVLPALPDAPALTMAVVRIIAADGPQAGTRLLDNRYPISGTTAVQPDPLAWRFSMIGVPATRAVAEVELMSGAGGTNTEWSVRSDTFAIARGARVALRPAMGRGPMSNLTASSVTVRALWGDPVSVGQVEDLLTTLDGRFAQQLVAVHSLDPAIATVDPRVFTARGVSVGVARIVAMAGFRADTIRIVVAPPVTRLEGVASVAATSVGDTLVVPAFAYDATGRLLRHVGVTWTASDTTILRQLRDGAFLALRNGEATVQARLLADTTLRVTTRATVRQEAVGVRMLPASGTLKGVGRGHALTAAALDRRGNAIPGLAWSWSATGPVSVTPGVDRSVASLVAADPGDATVTATVAGVEATASYRVVPDIVGLAVEPSTLVISAGQTARLSALGEDDRGRRYPVPAYFTTAGGAVATVDTTGVVTARRLGFTTISAIDSLGHIATVPVTVQEVAPGAIEKLAGDGQVIAAGSEATIAPQVRVRDTRGVPMAGQPVVFTEDRGSFELRTGADGIARYEHWIVVGKARTAALVATVPGTSLRATFTATVVAGPAVMAGILVQPSDSATSGVPLARQPVAELHDEYGNPVHLAGEVVWLELEGGANVGATLGGTTTAVTDAQGIARFGNVSIVGPPGSYKLSYRYTSWGLLSTPVVVR